MAQALRSRLINGTSRNRKTSVRQKTPSIDKLSIYSWKKVFTNPTSDIQNIKKLKKLTCETSFINSVAVEF